MSPPALFEALWTRAMHLGRNPRVRGEIGWVAATKVGEFLILFLLLKVLTNALGKDGYGEYNLAETSLILIAAAVLSPVSESYIRELYQGRVRGEGRHAGLFVLRWFSGATLGIALAAVILATPLGDAFGVAPATVAAAGVAFFADRWRILGLEVMSMSRQRRRWALSSLVYHAALVASITLAVHWFTPTPSVALCAFAATAGLFALITTGPVIGDILRLPVGPPSQIASMAVGFGIPFGMLLLLQWIQGFADRFLIKAVLEDAAAVGLYAAAYQVCGAPFTLLFRIMQNLLRPIAYQLGDQRNPESLWSADKVLFAGVLVQVICGILTVTLLVWVGPALIVLMTNPTFEVDRATVAALATGRFAQMLGTSLQPVFAVHHAMNRVLYYRIAGAALTLAICYPLTVRLGGFGTALGTSLALSLYLLILLLAPKGAVSLALEARRSSRNPDAT